jgi:hypothetical protein
MNLTITNPTETVTNPTVIVRTSQPTESWAGESRSVKGEFARVHIKTAADWMLIRMMQHQVDYFAPCSGNGLIVKAELLKR